MKNPSDMPWARRGSGALANVRSRESKMRQATGAGSRWVAALGGVLGAAGAGCSSTCADGDLECLMESMVLYDLGTRGSADLGSTAHLDFEPRLDSVADGPIEVVWIQTDTLPESGSGSTPPPTITNQPPPFTLGTSSSVGVEQLDYEDPACACRPAFCHVNPNIRYFRSPCTPMSGDGYRVGRTYLGVRYESVPERTTADLQVDIVPVCTQDCNPLSGEAVSGDGSFDDPLEFGPGAESALSVGTAVSVTITIVSEADASDSGGGGTSQCSGWTSYCGSCGQMRACASSDGSSCVDAWYEAGGGVRIDCASCGNCTQAANDLFYACGCDPS
jgi:hypothetical protein